MRSMIVGGISHGKTGSSVIMDINEAYTYLKNADIYDVSTEGAAAWGV